jgi:septum formation protein
MFTAVQPLILASGSPRRQELLAGLGIDFSVTVPVVDESPLENEDARGYVLRLARLKGEAVALEQTSSWVVAADTVVIDDGRLLTKPDTEAQALDMLMQLAGREHQVRTGYCLYCAERSFRAIDSVVSTVRFRSFGLDWAQSYVQTGEPMDKAGGYGIQDRGGVLVEAVEGSYSNVVGLPLAELVGLLCSQRVVIPSSAQLPKG